MAKQAHITAPTRWPIMGSFGFLFLTIGFARVLHEESMGWLMLTVGLIVVVGMITGWLSEVVQEHLAGLRHDTNMESSFRWGMIWFIFSEVMFFASFFGALFYVRIFVLPWLAGESMPGVSAANMDSQLTHLQYWPSFQNIWPTLKNPSPMIEGAKSTIGAWGIPAWNTLILLTSGVTLTVAHFGVVQGKRIKALMGQAATILLGMLFLYYQFHEYYHAYSELNLKLHSGIYGNLFFFLTGFHGFHVTLGTIMLSVILFRMWRGDFTPKHHFAFEAVSWYWHFVDVVWLILFVFVYWI